MALNASDIKLVLPQAEFVRTVSPSGVTNIAKRRGVGGLTRSKFLTHEIGVKLEGDITSPKLLKALMGTSELIIDIHDVEVSGAIANSFEIGITADDPITFSAELMAKNIATISPGSPTLPGELFSKAEGIIAVNGLKFDVNSLSISGSRNVEAVYGGTGVDVLAKMKPTSFKIGTWEYTGSLEIEPDSVNDLIKLWDPANQKWVLLALFVDAIDSAHTFGFVATGGIISESSGDIDADVVSASQSLDLETFEVGEVKKDTFTGDGTTTDFVLTNSPIANSILILVDGVENTDYTFDSGTDTVSFASAPSNGANIEVYYLVDVVI